MSSLCPDGLFHASINSTGVNTVVYLEMKQETDALLFPTWLAAGLLSPGAARARLDGSSHCPGDKVLSFCYWLLSTQLCQHHSLPPSHAPPLVALNLSSRLPGFPAGSGCETLTAQTWARAPCWAMKSHMRFCSLSLGLRAGEQRSRPEPAHGSHQIAMFYFPELFLLMAAPK